MVVVVFIITDWVRYQHASCRRDGNRANEQKDGRETRRSGSAANG